MTESKIEKIIREVSFSAQCAEMALQSVKSASYDRDLLSFPEVQELYEVNYRLDYLAEDLKNLAEKLRAAHMTGDAEKVNRGFIRVWEEGSGDGN